MSMESKRVAIIGAGACGLVAIKSCLEEQLEPVCFERSNHVGGMWKYSEDLRSGQACVSYTTVINTCKEMMCFSDFPIPSHFPNFMHNTKVFEYLQLYADHFMLGPHIKFRHEVIEVSRSESFSADGKWTLCFKDIQTGKVTTEQFDAVMLCTGHHSKPHVPKFDGHNVFQGRILHTNDYRNHEHFHGKKVVVIGLGNSGGDVAVDLSRIAKQVVVSTRRGTWVVHRIADNGMPVDYFSTRRWLHKLMGLFPSGIKNSIIEGKLNARFDHALYGLQPEHRFDAQHPTVNDELPNRVLNGTVSIRPDVKRFTQNGVEFVDGAREDNVDVIILATGYTFEFPYLEEGVVEVMKNKVNLFKQVFPPDLQPATLSVIGLFQPLGAVNPPAELQCRWATQIFKGVISLPSSNCMWKDIEKKRQDMAGRYVQSQRHTIQVDFIPFMDELAELVGCRPNLGRLFLKDPILSLKAFFGPCTPYQYRLEGPGKWSGARDAILSQWERVCAPLKTRQVIKHQTSSSSAFKVVLLVAVILVAVMINLYVL